jgi:hypothetical protein
MIMGKWVEMIICRVITRDAELFTLPCWRFAFVMLQKEARPRG